MTRVKFQLVPGENQYSYQGWTIFWTDELAGIAIYHAECADPIYEGHVEMEWGRCPECQTPVEHSTIAHLMQAYKLLKKV